LKPANIKLRPDGTVKVLDFGLAKLVGGPADGGPHDGGRSSRPPIDMSMSPTITSPAMATSAGMLLGTAAYMSPEQAKGRAADHRSDIFAFGCVLYELASGKRAFIGEDISDTIAAVLRGEPDWSACPLARRAPSSASSDAAFSVSGNRDITISATCGWTSSSRRRDHAKRPPGRHRHSGQDSPRVFLSSRRQP
jgi:serine/threonine protein kinase